MQGPKRKDMEKSHYSGKAERHTAKVQYTVNTNGLIIHNARHSPGRVHDVKVYRMKHPTFLFGLPFRDGSDGKGTGLYRQGLPGGAEDVRRGGSVRADQAQARKKALGRRKGVQQDAFQDPRLRGACDLQGQDVTDHGRQVPEPAEEIRPYQRHRVRAGQPKVAVAGRTGNLTGATLERRKYRYEK